MASLLLFHPWFVCSVDLLSSQLDCRWRTTICSLHVLGCVRPFLLLLGRQDAALVCPGLCQPGARSL